MEHLSGSNRPSDTELLFASLDDPSTQVRCAAVRALAKTNTADSRRNLTGALQDASFEVREAAAYALGRLSDPGSANALAASLNDPDVAVRSAAAGALRSMGWRPSTREELARFDIALGHTPSAVPITNVPTAPDLHPSQDTTFHRRLAAEALRERTDPARLKSLLADVRSNDLLTRISAVHDLGQFNNPQVTAELVKLFRHPDPETRLASAQVLAARDDAQPAFFLGLLQDASPEVRLAAVQFLGKVRHGHMVEVLFPLLSDASEPVRQAATAAIERIRQACAARTQPERPR